MKTDKFKSFLIEVGVEEIPTGLVDSIREQFRQNFLKELSENNIPAKNVKADATALRVVLYGEAESVSQPRDKKIQGPSVKAAFDNNGSPTKAYFGFVKSQGADKKDVVAEETSRGKYIFVKKKEQVRQTSEIIPEIIPSALSKISLPKYMKWDGSGFKFSRPVRTLLVIFGGRVLRFKFQNITSSDYTLVREGSVYKKIKVKSIEDYFNKMKQEKIIISPEERKQKIKRLLEAEARKVNAVLYRNQELLSEVSNLAERPNVLVCEFEREFLKLPAVVLLASMAKYQRVFALTDKNDKFLNKFLAVIENKPKDTSGVKKHYEFVLNARLKDAELFYRGDIKEPLDAKVDKLKGVLLHRKLGSLFDKVKRLETAADKIAAALSLNKQEHKNLLRAVYLSKADLLTRMVCEFPSLEGIMGGVYAEYFKEPKDAAAAISEHYKPRTNDDGLANNKLGALLSMLDKIYNVIGIIGIGITPSGSADPFAIRRQIQAVVRILVQYGLELSLEDLFSIIYDVLRNNLTADEEETKNIFLTMAKERFCVLMKEEDIPVDLVNAVINADFKVPFDAYLRIRKLLTIYDKRDFYRAAKVAERTANIVKGEKGLDKESADPNLFKEKEEQELWEVYLKHKDKIIEKINNKEYDTVTVLYGRVFYAIIHRFFDEVLVNVEDRVLRRNRKVMLYLINNLMAQRVADLKEMEVLKDAK